MKSFLRLNFSYRSLLLFFVTLLLPEFAFAQNTFTGFTFDPPPTDLSVSFLADIFGVVTGVLHGTGSQIIGTMLGIFNAAILTIGSVVIMYILFVGTLYTAHEGKPLGEKWGSLWVPIRAVIGIGAMIPQPSGYSFIQVFIMWLIVQGIGAADSIWAGALSYMERGGILVQQTQTLSTIGGGNNANNPNPQLAITAGNILKAETCMYALRNSLINQALAKQSPQQVPDFTSTLVVRGMSGASPPCAYNDPRYDTVSNCIKGPNGEKPGDVAGYIEFPGNVAYSALPLEKACGRITWQFSLLPTQIQDPNPPYQQITVNLPDTYGSANPGGLGASDSRSIAVQQMVLDMEPMAYQFAQIMVPTNSGSSSQDLKGSFPMPPSEPASTATDYISLMGPFYNEQNNQSIAQAKTSLENAKLQGWLMAGSYYFLLSSLNNAYSSAIQETTPPKIDSYPPDWSGSLFTNIATVLKTNLGNGTVTACPLGSCPLGANLQGQITNMDQYVCCEYNYVATAQTPTPIAPPIPTPNIPTESGNVSITTPAWWQNVGTNVNAATQIANPGAGVNFTSSIPNVTLNLGPLFEPIEKYFNFLPNKFNDLMNQMNAILHAQSEQNVDPIVGVSAMGLDILDAAEWIWINGAIWSAAVGLVLGAIPSGSLGTAATTFVVWIVGFLTVILMAMFEAGMMMAYYVPLIPFIIFLFTSLGWFVGVFEAMIAGPLVALGLTIPEGHHQFGAVAHAIMLLMNIFLRPTFIIFGFIAGAIMSHVGLWILNTGLGVALTAGQTPIGTDVSGVGVSGILRGIALILVYMTLVMQVVNRAFQLIYEIPNTVLRWLSTYGTPQFGEAESVGQVQSQLTQKFGAVGQVTGETGKQLMSVGPAGAKMWKQFHSGGGGEGGGGGGGEAG